VEGVIGKLNESDNVTFTVILPEIDHIDGSRKFPIVKNSKSHEKGSALPFVDTKYSNAHVQYNDLKSDIFMEVTKKDTCPLVKIFCKLPNPEKLEVSEFFFKGHLSIDKVNLNKRTLDTKVLYDKLETNKAVAIDNKIFIEIIGPPLVKEDKIETEFGAIHRIRNQLDVEI
jgi:hypothetical protein